MVSQHYQYFLKKIRLSLALPNRIENIPNRAVGNNRGAHVHRLHVLVRGADGYDPRATRHAAVFHVFPGIP